MEDDAPVEINKVAFGIILLMIPTSCLESTNCFPHLQRQNRRFHPLFINKGGGAKSNDQSGAKSSCQNHASI